MPKYFQSYSALAIKFLLKVIKLLLALKINYLPSTLCADRHNSQTSASSTSSEHFPHKTEKECLLHVLVIKQLPSILTNIKAKVVDHFEAVFLLNIDKKHATLFTCTAFDDYLYKKT